ncbi:MAG: PHP domain-containing protein [Chloroflexota bacterium]|nr:PHP domain-containing protein [Dehalococcoidia bacterium]MDW8253354.1 PHP domain-containing protein [Chloroflexota bacterium]
MFLDLHCHSIVSDDARATVEQYAKWIAALRRKGYRVDGIVLTEHRTFDRVSDYRALEDAYDLAIFKASELDTDAGHFLVYGVNDALLRRFDFADVRINAVELVRCCEAEGAIAVPAHPGRERVSFIDLAGNRDFSLVRVVEVLNGGSRPWENERAQRLAAERGYVGIAGSDAHFVNAIARQLTRFFVPVRSMDELVAALRSGAVAPATLADTQLGVE